MDDYKILREYKEAEQSGTLPEMPDELDEKCRNLIEEAFAQTKRRTWRKRLSTAAIRAAVVVLVILGISTVTVLSVDAFRVPVLNFLLDKSGKFATVTSEDIVNMEQENSDKIIRRFNEFIPADYGLVSCISTDALYSAAYQNADNYILRLTYTADECTLNVDAEDTAYISLDFGDYIAEFSEKNGYRLIWLDSQSNVVYTLFSDGMTKEEFWEFAYLLIS